MTNVLAVRDDYRAQTWAMLVQECSNSGLTKRESPLTQSVEALQKENAELKRKLEHMPAENTAASIFASLSTSLTGAANARRAF